MCRLAIFGKGFYGEKNKVKEVMQYLERRMGGHGNTFAFLKGGNMTIYRKGDFNKFPPKKALKLLEKHQDADYFFFHTRIRSTGVLSSKNLHPAVINKGELILFQNGTISYKEGIKFLTGSDWDTEITAMLVWTYSQNFKELSQALTKFSSIWIGVYKGKPFAISGGGDLVEGKVGNVDFIGSELPYGYKEKRLGKGSVWYNGEWIEKKSYTIPVYTYEDGYGYSYSRGYGYAYYTQQTKKKKTFNEAKITYAQPKICPICNKMQITFIKNTSEVSQMFRGIEVCKACVSKFYKQGEIRKDKSAVYTNKEMIVITNGKGFKMYDTSEYGVCKKCKDVLRKTALENGLCYSCRVKTKKSNVTTNTSPKKGAKLSIFVNKEGLGRINVRDVNKMKVTSEELKNFFLNVTKKVKSYPQNAVMTWLDNIKSEVVSWEEVFKYGEVSYVTKEKNIWTVVIKTPGYIISYFGEMILKGADNEGGWYVTKKTS